MTIVYVATSKNRLKVIEVENTTGNFVRDVQDIDPIVQPALENDDEKCVKPSFIGDNRRESEIDTTISHADLGGIGFLGSFSDSETATTEWIERHPTFDSLLYVFTSFWNRKSAIVTTYRILGLDNSEDLKCKTSSETVIRGRLKRLGSVKTKGLHVSHVTFSPDYFRLVRNDNDNEKHRSNPPSTLCVGHYMDGSLSFFDCSRDAALDEPIRVLGLPEVRPETRNSTYPNPLPSIHHVTYNPPLFNTNSTNENDQEGYEYCNYLLVSDTSKQGRVWTYAVDSLGLPISNSPASFRKVTYITPPPGWLTRILTSDWAIGLANYRIRRCVVHPHGRYVYMLLEFNAAIQVYEIDPFTGRIAGDCLQEIPAIDPNYFCWKKTTGIGVQAAAELYATATEVFVSNRGFNFWGGAAESSVRIFSIEDDGARLTLKQSLDCDGPVRHFFPDNYNRHLCPQTALVSKDKYFSSSPVTMFVGSGKGRSRRVTPTDQRTRGENDSNGASLEKFVRQDPEALGGTFERVGGASVGFDDITCIAVLD